jgi:hypothetical protein
MHDGTYLCTLDVRKAYLHLKMDDDGALLQKISTHKGPYKVKRLIFGVKVASNMFQRFMEQTLQGLVGVACFFDDVLAQAATLLQRIGSPKWYRTSHAKCTNAKFFVNLFTTWQEID